MTSTSIEPSMALRGRMSNPVAWTVAAWFGAVTQRSNSLRATAAPDPAPHDAGREAAAVREMAYRHLKTDPGFAADLFAAADRHERVGDGPNGG
jgi:hypothetical protein